jgi:DNA-binding MarR family transcriptional regulator
LFGEIQQRLTRLGLADDSRSTVMALIRSELTDQQAGSPADGQFAVPVARTFCKTAVRATEALGSASLSMLVMLADLFVAHQQERTVSVSSLCIASGAAPTTALRQIGQLEARGLVTRREDERDRRRTWVSPTPRALELVGGLLEEWTAVLG